MKTILIAGGGASGALLAAQLLRRSSDINVIVVEPRALLARGMAYSTECPLHLLNVPASNMSAFPEEPGHLVAWLAARGLDRYDECSFVPRTVYGDYLASVLEQARLQAGPERFLHLRDRVANAEENAAGVRVTLSSGASRQVAALVLATGNAAPPQWPGACGRFFNQAWAHGACVPNSADETVVLFGTGLTAVDAVLALRHKGHRGVIYLISRRGLLPRPHLAYECAEPEWSNASTARGLTNQIRASQNWRAAVDSLRPRTNVIWQGLGTWEQRRFLRHVRPWWDAHRHRMAPQIGETIAQLIRDGVVRVIAGRPGTMESAGDQVLVPVRLRGTGETLRIEASRVINCTGPETNLSRLADPLLRGLAQRGYLKPHPTGMGAQIEASGALNSDRMFAIGPLRLGSLIETVAMPEIRTQARDLANLIVARQRSVFSSRNGVTGSISVQQTAPAP